MTCERQMENKPPSPVPLPARERGRGEGRKLLGVSNLRRSVHELRSPEDDGKQAPLALATSGMGEG